ncbi:hypothetical protein M404DRAFT_997748 [Pisolithus tinctorius Marx 270]|uniref:Uncharacterized protein n=1 Tax=Pisolithus tinctorius Marx 270 TaxID=870435 RepID=A0A0C3PHQ6_PISTI|nr:hypothetical protein M404DRAFT_997748 [Pisolithus tinctorius Marx 270]
MTDLGTMGTLKCPRSYGAKYAMSYHLPLTTRFLDSMLVEAPRTINSDTRGTLNTIR